VYAQNPLLSFDVISDIHSAYYSTDLNNAFLDIKKNDTGSSVICMVGDLTHSQLPEQYDTLEAIIIQKAPAPCLLTVGNHDVCGIYGSINSTYGEYVATYKDKTHMPGVYFDTTINSYHFIFLGSEKSLSNQAYLSATQLQWLSARLALDSAEHKPVFIFLHQPLVNTVASTYPLDGYSTLYANGVAGDSALRTILKAYPNNILFTGHTHAPVTSANNYFRGPCHMVNDGAIAIGQGLFVKVYADSIVLEGRKFSTQKTIWTKTLLYNTAISNHGKSITTSQPGYNNAVRVQKLGRNRFLVSGSFSKKMPLFGRIYSLNGRVHVLKDRLPAESGVYLVK
jgi:predicted phosphodiesterase